MAKPLFKNYNYSFDKNEAKILINFCNQALKLVQGDPKYALDVKAFNSMIEKLSTDPSNVKLTKEEKAKLVLLLKENVKQYDVQIKKSWFFKRWLLKTMLIQYNNIINKHFSD